MDIKEEKHSLFQPMYHLVGPPCIAGYAVRRLGSPAPACPPESQAADPRSLPSGTRPSSGPHRHFGDAPEAGRRWYGGSSARAERVGPTHRKQRVIAIRSTKAATTVTYSINLGTTPGLFQYATGNTPSTRAAQSRRRGAPKLCKLCNSNMLCDNWE